MWQQWTLLLNKIRYAAAWLRSRRFLLPEWKKKAIINRSFDREGVTAVSPATQKIARFGLLTALALVLGLMDRAIPLSALLGGAAPGIKLGLANTVLLYAVYLMDWKSCVLLMLTKVVLSGLIFGSLSAIWFSLAGGALSLIVMLAVRKNPGIGALAIGFLAVAGGIVLIVSRKALKGQILMFAILIGVGALACFVIWFMIRRGVLCKVQGTSIAGAAAHNIGQVIAAWFVVHTPMLLNTYLPVLIGVGIIVGCLTGIVTERVMKALRMKTE